MLVANAIGTFCLAVQHGDLSNYSVINLGTYTTPDNNIFINRVEEFPLYLFIGVIGGLMGGVFCKAFMFLRRNITDQFPTRGQGRGRWQLLEVALVSIVTSLLLFYLPTQAWACKDRPEDTTDALDFTATTSNVTMPRGDNVFDQTMHQHDRFFCPPGQVNELGNILFGSRNDAIKRILSNPAQFKVETLLVVGLLFYVLLIITFGTALPSGIFTPSVLVGASLGGAAGIFFHDKLDSEISPSTFALLGVAALLAGIQRSTVSVCVILVEGTGQIKVLLPAIITVVVSRYVASLVYREGIFEAVMEWKNLPYLDHSDNKRRYDAIEVRDIMSDPPLESVRPYEQAQDLADLLRDSTHNGFPVVDSSTNKFLGLVRRDQIAALLECGVFDHEAGEFNASDGTTIPARVRDKTLLMRWAYHINDDRYDYVLHGPDIVEAQMNTSPSLRSAFSASLPTEFAIISQNDVGLIYVSWLNPEYSHCGVNLGAVMNRGNFCVPEFCPVSKAYTLFVSLGLRHLTVLGGPTGGSVVGVVTRQNLLPKYIQERTGL